MKQSYPRVRIKAFKSPDKEQTVSILGSFRNNPPRRGAAELMLAYRESPILQAVVRKIAFAVAGTKWHANMTLPNGQVQEMTKHSSSKFLSRGPSSMAGFQCTELETIHYLLVGESFAIIERDSAGRAYNRLTIPPHWVRSCSNPFRREFEVQSPESRSNVFIKQKDMLWFKQVDAFDPYGRGGGVGIALSDELRADESAAQHISSTLRNGALPSAILSGTKEHPLSETDVARMRESFESRFGGPQRSGRNFYSSSPLQVNTMGQSFKDLDLTNLRTFERNIIVNAFGFPPEMLGIVENSNRATIMGAEFLFMKHVVRPILIMRRENLNFQMEGEYEDGITFEFEDPVDEDWAFKLESMAGRPGAYTDDEHRSVSGFAPLPDGQGAFVQADEETDAPTNEEASVAKSIHTKAPDIPGALDAVDAAEFERILGMSLRAAFAYYGQDALDELSLEIDFDMANPRVVELIRTMAATSSSLIVGTTREALQKTLAEGIELGETTSDLVRRIRATVIDAGLARARTIARTEIVRASNAARTEAHRRAGIEKRSWLATEDGLVRTAHTLLNGDVVAMDEPFKVNGREGMYPGGFGVAELDINCRCSVLAEIDIDGEEIRYARTREETWKAVDSSRGRFEEVLENAMNRVFSSTASRISGLVKDW